MNKAYLFLSLFIAVGLSNVYGQVVIYEIYPGGGAAGATYQYEAIILQGPPNQSLNGWSIQYAGATIVFGGSKTDFNSTHAFNSEGYFYMQAGNLGSGAPLPFMPNIVLSFTLGNNGGKLALVNNTNHLPAVACPLPNASVVDFVGYGPTANCSEGSPITTWAGSVTSSMRRTQETNNNSVDFTISTMPLPVELAEFTARSVPNGVLLTWSTASETQNDYFSIERSGDGVNFNAIGEKDGNGTTAHGSRYTFTDEQPLNGNNYYRLKQVDEDETSTYSPVRVVRFGKADQVAVYPNPTVTGTFNLTYHTETEGTLAVSLKNIAGVEVSSQIVNVYKGQNLIPVSSVNNPDGPYWIVVTSETQTSVVPVQVKSH